jgi:uncharacterized protein (TIGR02421 family)
MALTAAQKSRVERAATALREAERSVRVLRTVAWPLAAREAFFAAGARELPRIEYPRWNPAESLAAVAAARRHWPGVPVLDAWLERVAAAIESGARMLGSLGTNDFYRHSVDLYGGPTATLLDHGTTPLGLAEQLDRVLASVAEFDFGAPDPSCQLAWSVAARIREAVQRLFGDLAPEVMIVDDLSANALAGTKAIRLRRTACFSDRDVQQLIHHEAFIHVATALNGRAQASIPILGAGHAGTTSTQEGLAVFAEMMSGTMDPHRLHRLAERVLAIHQAAEGADFLDVYRFFLGRGHEPEQAFENARRVFRGGVLTGGAPFTKDVVYLHGLLRVHNFLRSAVAAHRPDCLRLLFVGKLDIDDIPALALLAREGLVQPPRFLPPWAADLRFLISYLAYSAFLNQVDLSRIRLRYQQLLDDTPPLTEWGKR